MNEIWLRIQAFFEILSTRNVLIEVGIIALCLIAGGLVALQLGRRYRTRRDSTPMALTWEYFATHGTVVVIPLVMALLLDLRVFHV